MQTYSITSFRAEASTPLRAGRSDAWRRDRRRARCSSCAHAAGRSDHLSVPGAGSPSNTSGTGGDALCATAAPGGMLAASGNAAVDGASVPWALALPSTGARLHAAQLNAHYACLRLRPLPQQSCAALSGATARAPRPCAALNRRPLRACRSRPPIPRPRSPPPIPRRPPAPPAGGYPLALVLTHGLSGGLGSAELPLMAEAAAGAGVPCLRVEYGDESSGVGAGAVADRARVLQVGDRAAGACGRGPTARARAPARLRAGCGRCGSVCFCVATSHGACCALVHLP